MVKISDMIFVGFEVVILIDDRVKQVLIFAITFMTTTVNTNLRVNVLAP